MYQQSARFARARLLKKTAEEHAARINEPHYKLWAIMITNGSNTGNTPGNGVVGGRGEGIGVVVIAEWEGKGKGTKGKKG